MFGYKGFSSKKSAGKTREETHDKQKEVLRKRTLHGSNHHRRIGDVPGGRDQRLKPESSSNPLSLSRPSDSVGLPLAAEPAPKNRDVPENSSSPAEGAASARPVTSAPGTGCAAPAGGALGGAPPGRRPRG